MSNRADDRGWTPDGNLDWSGGVDANRPPVNLSRDQLADAVNATMRGIRIRPRPGFKKRDLSFGLGYHLHTAITDVPAVFPNVGNSVSLSVDITNLSYDNLIDMTMDHTEIFVIGGVLRLDSIDSATQFTATNVNDTTHAGNAIAIGSEVGFYANGLSDDEIDASVVFKTGRWQHGAFWDGNGIPTLLSSQGGRQFQIDLRNWKVTEITPRKPVATTEMSFTMTAANFTIPAVGADVTVTITPAEGVITGMSAAHPNIRFGSIILEYQSTALPNQFTVRNVNAAAHVGTVIGFPYLVEFETDISPAPTEITELDPNDDGFDIGWSVQAENYWIYQDNNSYPIIYNGAESRRADPEQYEVPVGNVMSYTMGRLCVGLPDRVSYRVGDIVFGSSGTPSLGHRDAMLKFTENNYLNEGGDFIARVFGANSANGFIRSMTPLNMLDQQLGQGPLLIGQPSMVFTVQLPFDRTVWKDLNWAMQTANPLIGPLSQTSTINVNGDVWYRGTDGIRSFIAATRDFTSWGNTPMSGEVSPILDTDTQWLLEHSSAVLFNNRLLMTVSPARDQFHGIYHRGLVSLDFDLVSDMRDKKPPAWEGIWTGLRILQVVSGLVSGEERCFVYTLNGNDEIELWEIMPGQRWDDDMLSTSPITWTFDCPAYHCGDQSQFKRLIGGRFVVENMRGDVTITVKYRSDENPCWQSWDSFILCAKEKDCLVEACEAPHQYREQQRSVITMHAPPDEFDTINGRRYCTGYQFQPRFEISGYAEIKLVKIFAKNEPERLEHERTYL